ncbi:Uma2 family endonuclease [Stratiformator vulcanicus]|uniref:Putative restriction endonuclease domain-containing protein n=1 Tax=Stratiformator vulcanicus TaxID=2527980 RepID=A0A517R3K7_9PLAN|nr:Uma2 family endonuclease [Stratiformator vulcanicus]QDT38472.1 hypothetical protein Pan189_28660 [Stratiformator vulcanicus]
MPVLVLDEFFSEKLVTDRQERGVDRPDEVWDGLYIVMPSRDNQHQELITHLLRPLHFASDEAMRGTTFPGCNVSDRAADWKENHRCPDIAVYLKGNPAIDRGTHWQGGPDLAIEIVSPGDRSRDKLRFYTAVGTREVLIVDRDPWQLELYRNDGSPVMSSVGIAKVNGDAITTESVPLTWRLTAGSDRPLIEVESADPPGHWQI